MHARVGKITSINDHYGSAEHAQITVKHGRRKRDKNAGKKGVEAPLVGYDQHESRVVIPKAHAKNYKLGQSVHVGIAPHEGGDADMDDTGEAETGQNGAVSEASAVPGKQSGAASAKSTRAKSKIMGAMKGKKK